MSNTRDAIKAREAATRAARKPKTQPTGGKAKPRDVVMLPKEEHPVFLEQQRSEDEDE